MPSLEKRLAACEQRAARMKSPPVGRPPKPASLREPGFWLDRKGNVLVAVFAASDHVAVSEVLAMLMAEPRLGQQNDETT
jgi:hypothetical protein